ncbi:MAG: DNA replication and repair protein RecF [Thermoanaerobaculia bacterium]|nr:DNA replication and repair protein RecF [Thermoanaerobaculia bacterium]
MVIGTLSVESFRNLAPARLGFHPRLNLLVGANGQGKTNVLESLALVSGRASFRTADLADVVREGANDATVTVGLVGESAGELAARIGKGRREHFWNGRKVSRVEASRRLPLVVLTAADLGRLGGPPSDRRRALDRVAVAHEPALAAEHRRYEKARADRVALLAAPGRPDRDALAAFEEILASAGAAIAASRRRWVGPLGRRVEENARLLGLPYREISFRLVSELPAHGSLPLLADALRSGLRQREESERRAGRALFGPHRDDLVLLFEERPLAPRASSGEARALVLAWALAERGLLAEAGGRLPVFAFDDFDSEWDPDVLTRFARALPDDGQVLLTSARERVARELPLPAGAVWRVEAGRLAPSGPAAEPAAFVPAPARWPGERSDDVLAS